MGTNRRDNTDDFFIIFFKINAVEDYVLLYVTCDNLSSNQLRGKDPNDIYFV